MRSNRACHIFQRCLDAVHLAKIAGGNFLIPQVIIVCGYQRFIAAAGEPVDNFEIADAGIVCDVCGIRLRAAVGSFFPLLRSAADVQNEGIGSPVVGLIHADGQLGVVQTVGGQLLIGDLKLMVQEDALVKANAVLQ